MICPLTYGGAGVEYDLRPIDPVHEPVLGVMAAVADVHGDPSVDGLEHPVARIALQYTAKNRLYSTTYYSTRSRGNKSEKSAKTAETSVKSGTYQYKNMNYFLYIRK